MVESCLLKGAELMFDNIGVSFSTFMVILFFILGFIAYSRDVRVGMLVHLTLYSSLFLWFYNAQKFHNCDYNWVLPLVFVILFFVFLTIIIFPTKLSQPRGGFV